jgi:hypothetical protein
MGSVRQGSPTIRRRPARRPARRLVQDRSPLGDLEEHETHPVGQLPQITGLLLIDLLDGGEVGPDLLVQRAIEPSSHEEEDTGREDADDERQRTRVPQGEACTDTGGEDPHGPSRRRTKPTPRTV